MLAERALPEPVGSMAKGSWQACCQSGLVNSPCTTTGTHSFAVCSQIAKHARLLFSVKAMVNVKAMVESASMMGFKMNILSL